MKGRVLRSISSERPIVPCPDNDSKSEGITQYPFTDRVYFRRRILISQWCEWLCVRSTRLFLRTRRSLNPVAANLFAILTIFGFTTPACSSGGELNKTELRAALMRASTGQYHYDVHANCKLIKRKILENKFYTVSPIWESNKYDQSIFNIDIPECKGEGLKWENKMGFMAHEDFRIYHIYFNRNTKRRNIYVIFARGFSSDLGWIQWKEYLSGLKNYFSLKEIPDSMYESIEVNVNGYKCYPQYLFPASIVGLQNVESDYTGIIEIDNNHYIVDISVSGVLLRSAPKAERRSIVEMNRLDQIDGPEGTTSIPECRFVTR